MEKLDDVQQAIFELEKRLIALNLNTEQLDKLEQQLLKINTLYKPKKEIVRLSKIYFIYNLSENEKLKYAQILKRTISQNISSHKLE